MSKLLNLTNRLKAQASWHMLTASQRIAFDELEKRWRYPDRINLCGPPGSGKTFMGWVMARQFQAHFYASPRTLDQDQPPYPTQIILDNAPTEGKKLRRLLSEVQLRQVHRLLLITQSPICLGFPVIALPSPTEADINTIYENLSQLHFHSSCLVTKGNFWNVVHSVL